MGDQRRWEGRTTIKKNEREGGKCQNTIAHFHDGGRIYDTRYVIVYIFLFFYFKILIHFIYFSAKQVKKTTPTTWRKPGNKSGMKPCRQSFTWQTTWRGQT